MEKSSLPNTPFIWRYKLDDPDFPGYWINLRDVTSENDEELILFMGLSEETCESIFNRLNLFLEHWLKDSFGIF